LNENDLEEIRKSFFGSSKNQKGNEVPTASKSVFSSVPRKYASMKGHRGGSIIVTEKEEIEAKKFR
jgi:hypothetical protein